MFKFLNNKLYNQYYPLKTEEDKLQFLNKHSEDARMIVLYLHEKTKQRSCSDIIYEYSRTIGSHSLNQKLRKCKYDNNIYEDIKIENLNVLLKFANTETRKQKTFTLLLSGLGLLLAIILLLYQFF